MRVVRLSQALLLVNITFLVAASAQSYAASKRASTETYLAQLHSQGKERVIVRFKNNIDKSVLSKYNARVIRKLKIINAIVCEIDQRCNVWRIVCEIYVS